MPDTSIGLEQSTALFGKLADPNGANNPLSQVLYGLALRLVIQCLEILPVHFRVYLAGDADGIPTGHLITDTDGVAGQTPSVP